jgi:hypothetical protein
MLTTYYLTWPDRAISVVVIERGAQGRAEARIVGRRPRFAAALGGQPFPTADAAVRLLANKVGAKIARRGEQGIAAVRRGP